MYVALLTGFDNLDVDLEAAGGELDPDCGLELEAELVLSEPRQQVRLVDAGVANDHHVEQVVVVAHSVLAAAAAARRSWAFLSGLLQAFRLWIPWAFGGAWLSTRK